MNVVCNDAHGLRRSLQSDSSEKQAPRTFTTKHGTTAATPHIDEVAFQEGTIMRSRISDLPKLLPPGGGKPNPLTILGRARLDPSKMHGGAKRTPSIANFTAGGDVTGPGGPTDDAVDAHLSSGEYVLPADTVAAIGRKKLDAIKAATHRPTGRAPRIGQFADGGMRRPVLTLADGGGVDAEDAQKRSRLKIASPTPASADFDVLPSDAFRPMISQSLQNAGRSAIRSAGEQIGDAYAVATAPQRLIANIGKSVVGKISKPLAIAGDLLRERGASFSGGVLKSPDYLADRATDLSAAGDKALSEQADAARPMVGALVGARAATPQELADRVKAKASPAIAATSQAAPSVAALPAISTAPGDTQPATSFAPNSPTKVYRDGNSFSDTAPRPDAMPYQPRGGNFTVLDGDSPLFRGSSTPAIAREPGYHYDLKGNRVEGDIGPGYDTRGTPALVIGQNGGIEGPPAERGGGARGKAIAGLADLASRGFTHGAGALASLLQQEQEAPLNAARTAQIAQETQSAPELNRSKIAQEGAQTEEGFARAGHERASTAASTREIARMDYLAELQDQYANLPPNTDPKAATKLRDSILLLQGKDKPETFGATSIKQYNDLGQVVGETPALYNKFTGEFANQQQPQRPKQPPPGVKMGSTVTINGKAYKVTENGYVPVQ